MIHVLPKLNYDENLLSPILSAESMRYHYGAHHQTYVNNLNKLIVATEFEEMILEDIVRRANPGLILNNAAQHWNHSFYWNCLTPNKNPNLEVKFLQALEQKFGSYDAFEEQFTKAAMTVFGSGWAWLVVNKAGELEIKTTGNADNPLRTFDTPIFTCDVWEHAYYIDYRNARDKYLKSFWEIVDWDFVAKNYALAKGNI